MFLDVRAGATGADFKPGATGAEGGTGREQGEPEELLRATAEGYLREIRRYRGTAGGTLLEVNAPDEILLRAAGDDGYTVSSLTGPHLGETLDENGFGENSFDVCVVRGGLQRVEDPVAFLKKVRKLIKDTGILYLTVPSLDSRAARVMRQRWPRFNRENQSYFDRQTIQTALFKAGFKNIHIQPEEKTETLAHLRGRIQPAQLPPLLRTLFALRVFIPGFVKRMRFSVSLSEISVLCRPAEFRERPLLSVVMPVFNEKATFRQVMDELLPRKIAGIDREIIIVESNSTDGTREDVRQYADDPGVNVIWEERPRGKGHAVRTGLKHAAGDFVIIQDGDLEYDLNDYDILLEPLIAGRTAFVLGTRHSAGWKIRQFQESFIADFMNFGHRALVILMNLLYRQKMTDPFTMYKVFRKDCLYGLRFECNRFNFDIELVCKLLRKGYTPLEVPINYRSRSFSEGKKVKIFRDPPTWIKAIFKYRITNVYDPFSPPAEQAG
jgi:SAM-dependent methyltransferase